jgi:hypothetical protein
MQQKSLSVLTLPAFEEKMAPSNPIGKVFKLMENGEEDSVVFFYVVFSKDLNR